MRSGGPEARAGDRFLHLHLLLIGGIVAAPLGGLIVTKLPTQRLLLMVGIVLTVTSLYGVRRALA